MNAVDGDRDFASSGDGYRSPTTDPRELRSRAANRRAALALIAAIVIVIALLAAFA